MGLCYRQRLVTKASHLGGGAGVTQNETKWPSPHLGVLLNTRHHDRCVVAFEETRRDGEKEKESEERMTDRCYAALLNYCRRNNTLEEVGKVCNRSRRLISGTFYLYTRIY